MLSTNVSKQYNDLKRLLKANQDVSYCLFQSKLVPTNKTILGVRIPIIRALAKTSKITELETLLKMTNRTILEEVLLTSAIISHSGQSFEKMIPFLEDIISCYDNWEETDFLATSLKQLKKEPEIGLKWINKLLAMDTYQIRLGYVLLLNYYILDQYLVTIFELVENNTNSDYYVKMAIAWLLSMCYIKYPKETEKYLKKSTIDDWTYNKTIQKCIESKQITKEQKNKLKAQKR